MNTIHHDRRYCSITQERQHGPADVGHAARPRGGREALNTTPSILKWRLCSYKDNTHNKLDYRFTRSTVLHNRREQLLIRDLRTQLH